MSRINYINEDGKIDWQKFELLTEDEQDEEMDNWTPEQERQYFLRNGYMTIDEFTERMLAINREVCKDNE